MDRGFSTGVMFLHRGDMMAVRTVRIQDPCPSCSQEIFDSRYMGAVLF